MKPYTSKAKKAIDLAARISKKMNYSYVGTEHILAGLIKEGTGVAAEVLTACNVEYDKLISMIEDLISPGDNIEVMTGMAIHQGHREYWSVHRRKPIDLSAMR